MLSYFIELAQQLPTWAQVAVGFALWTALFVPLLVYLRRRLRLRRTRSVKLEQRSEPMPQDHPSKWAEDIKDESPPLARPAQTPPLRGGRMARFKKRFTHHAVDILFGTNRRPAPDERKDQRRLAQFGAERTGELVLGKATITVPFAHQRGRVERPWALRAFGRTIFEQEEDPEKHFTRAEVSVLTSEEFREEMRRLRAKSVRNRDSAFVFIHGFHVGFDAALYRTAQLAYDLDFDGVPFVFSWPARSGVLDYKHDLDSAFDARSVLRRFLDLVMASKGLKRVHLIAHSMGNVVLTEALRDYASILAAGKQPVTFSEVIFAAPDIAADTFANVAREFSPLALSATLYASSNDKALLISKKVGGDIPRAGDVPLTGPLIVDGVDSIDVSTVSTDFFGLNHSAYAERSALIEDLALLFKSGVRPPHQRFPSYQKLFNAKLGAYWRYLRQPEPVA